MNRVESEDLILVMMGRAGAELSFRLEAPFPGIFRGATKRSW